MGGGMRGLRGRRLVLMLMRWIDGWMVLLDGAGISYFEGQGMGFLSLRLHFASIFIDDLIS
jgi:hypothetical protein